MLLIHGDARHIPLADGVVQCVVTSPPYWGLRDYGIAPLVWGGDPHCDHVWSREYCERCGAWRGQLGLEPTPDLYVQHMVEIGREIRRVLRDDGVFFLNIGDSYIGSGNGANDHRPDGASISQNTAKYRGQHPGAGFGIPAKNLALIPARLALALQADGWIVRDDIIWDKPDAMPESVRDRPTRSHEHVLMLTKHARYYWDWLAVAEPATTDRHGIVVVEGGVSRVIRNTRDVWRISTATYSRGHFAVMSRELARRCIVAATSEAGACALCGTPYRRIVRRESVDDRADSGRTHSLADQRMGKAPPPERGWSAIYRTEGWEPTCAHREAGLRPCIVLDPFAGSGTTLLVARALGRIGVGVEISMEYIALAREEIRSHLFPSWA